MKVKKLNVNLTAAKVSAAEIDLKEIKAVMNEAQMKNCQHALDFLAIGNMQCRQCGEHLKPKPPRTIEMCRCFYEYLKRQLPVAPMRNPARFGYANEFTGFLIEIRD